MTISDVGLSIGHTSSEKNLDRIKDECSTLLAFLDGRMKGKKLQNNLRRQTNLVIRKVRIIA
ncbi:hypothetical protein [Limnofasciculus baicalensis]|uniref:Uncharacterized protein n=1 Tax=Limnofasciculus baicalensis BBK-W-15 TaxID=2699891 RepID=A0AAE3KMN9_9CYAN|nr:hypothetical protein [Limnofasciculus baicalensis]MCP2729675.1 hypothetical protein [Limnofasciculus baicalensis BBK-W-15]